MTKTNEPAQISAEQAMAQVKALVPGAHSSSHGMAKMNRVVDGSGNFLGWDWKDALVRLSDHSRLGGAEQPKELCGKYAASFIPRRGEFFSCCLPKDHPGDEHLAGGTCFKHGRYVMQETGVTPQCPYWPDCIPAVPAPPVLSPKSGETCISCNGHGHQRVFRPVGDGELIPCWKCKGVGVVEGACDCGFPVYAGECCKDDLSKDEFRAEIQELNTNRLAVNLPLLTKSGEDLMRLGFKCRAMLQPLPTPPAAGSAKMDKHSVKEHFSGDDYHSRQIWERVQGFTYGEFATLLAYIRAAQSKPVATEGGLPPLDEDDPEWTLAANEVKRARVSGITEQESDRSLYVTLGSLRIRERQLRDDSRPSHEVIRSHS